jgi:hypothetical protein
MEAERRKAEKKTGSISRLGKIERKTSKRKRRRRCDSSTPYSVQLLTLGESKTPTSEPLSYEHCSQQYERKNVHPAPRSSRTGEPFLHSIQRRSSTIRIVCIVNREWLRRSWLYYSFAVFVCFERAMGGSAARREVWCRSGAATAIPVLVMSARNSNCCIGMDMSIGGLVF